MIQILAQGPVKRALSADFADDADYVKGKGDVIPEELIGNLVLKTISPIRLSG
jgi:hypothetical protein